jgi:hypothetical protein
VSYVIVINPLIPYNTAPTFLLEVIHLIKHIKRLWGHYLALLILSIALFFPISWVYHFFRVSFGYEAGLISLSITVMIVVIFIVRGALHTHMVIRDLKQKAPCTNQNEADIPLLFRILKICPKLKSMTSETQGSSGAENPLSRQVTAFPRKHRGKHPRFPEDKIRKAVLKWENRDPSFSVVTLEEFLGQEFGSGPDGILLMAPSTFYDWRTRVLKEIEAQTHE